MPHESKKTVGVERTQQTSETLCAKVSVVPLTREMKPSKKKILCKTLVKSPSVAKRRRVRKQRRNCSVTGVSTEKRASRQPKRKQCVRSVVLCRVEIRQPMGSAPLATMRSVQRRATLSDAS